jgi:anti-sigma factor RsiW
MPLPLPRDIVLDLLPVYLEGEASEATRAAVDEYLRTDPELASRVSSGTAVRLIEATVESPAAGLEMRSLTHARRTLAAMRWLFGFACFFTAVMLSLEVTRDERGTVSVGLLLLRHPSAMIVPLLAAIGCWAAYFRLRHQRRGDVR